MILIVLVGLLGWLTFIKDRWKRLSKIFLKTRDGEFYYENPLIYKEIIL